jgi:hypothetical protein
MLSAFADDEEKYDVMRPASSSLSTFLGAGQTSKVT